MTKNTPAPELKDNFSAKSAWEEAQMLKKTRQPLGHEVELKIPGVLYVSVDENGDYLIYVTIDGETTKLTNMEGI